MLSLCRYPGFDGRRQSIDTTPRSLVELAIHKLDAKMSFDLKNELENIDGVDFQNAAKQRLIVVQVLWSHVRDPQAAEDKRLELLLNIFHD